MKKREFFEKCFLWRQLKWFEIASNRIYIPAHAKINRPINVLAASNLSASKQQKIEPRKEYTSKSTNRRNETISPISLRVKRTFWVKCWIALRFIWLNFTTVSMCEAISKTYHACGHQKISLWQLHSLCVNVILFNARVFLCFFFRMTQHLLGFSSQFVLK